MQSERTPAQAALAMRIGEVAKRVANALLFLGCVNGLQHYQAIAGIRAHGLAYSLAFDRSKGAKQDSRSLNRKCTSSNSLKNPL